MHMQTYARDSDTSNKRRLLRTWVELTLCEARQFHRLLKHSNSTKIQDLIEYDSVITFIDAHSRARRSTTHAYHTHAHTQASLVPGVGSSGEFQASTGCGVHATGVVLREARQSNLCLDTLLLVWWRWWRLCCCCCAYGWY